MAPPPIIGFTVRTDPRFAVSAQRGLVHMRRLPANDGTAGANRPATSSNGNLADAPDSDLTAC
jgi:hypothetical protein